MHFSEKRSKRKTCGRNLGEWGEKASPGPGSSLLLVLSRRAYVSSSLLLTGSSWASRSGVCAHPTPLSLGAPARGLTFPEVLSHSASCYSLWQVRLHHSERQQTWAKARRRGLFHTSHWSSLLEVLRSQGVYRRSVEVSITLLAWHATPGASQVWGVVRGRGGGLVDGGEGHRSDSSAVSAVRLPKTKLHGWFSWVQWSRVTQVPHPEVKIEAWFTCHFAPSAVATHHEGVRDHLLIRPVSRRVIGGFREKVIPLLNWLFTLLAKERCADESSHYCTPLRH